MQVGLYTTWNSSNNDHRSRWKRKIKESCCKICLKRHQLSETQTFTCSSEQVKVIRWTLQHLACAAGCATLCHRAEGDALLSIAATSDWALLDRDLVSSCCKHEFQRICAFETKRNWQTIMDLASSQSPTPGTRRMSHRHRTKWHAKSSDMPRCKITGGKTVLA